MLKIRFYNSQQKYTDQTEPFKRGETNCRIRAARELVSDRSDLEGWTIYEQVGSCWLPYQPFNGYTRYDAGRMTSAPLL